MHEKQHEQKPNYSSDQSDVTITITWLLDSSTE